MLFQRCCLSICMARTISTTRYGPLVTPKRHESPQTTTGLDGQPKKFSHPNGAISHPNALFFPTVRDVLLKMPNTTTKTPTTTTTKNDDTNMKKTNNDNTTTIRRKQKRSYHENRTTIKRKYQTQNKNMK